jgi:Zn-dependent peptidase ImmA (M78 family)
LIFLKNKKPALILINSNDDKNAEIFSLLHEFGHYLLDEEDYDSDILETTNKRIEEWCNNFAYHFMITEEIEKKEGFNKENKSNLINPNSLKKLSEKYALSKHAFIFRFYKLGIITQHEYDEFKSRNPFKGRREKKASGGDYHLTNKDRLSRRYIELVYSNYSTGNLSLSETYEFLGVRSTDRVHQLLEAVHHD